MPKQTINYALAATLLSQHVTLDEAAKQVGAKDGNTLRVGLARRGVTATLARRSEDQKERAVTVANKAVADASEALRRDFTDILAKHVGALNKVPGKSNLKHLRQVANVAEPLARTAKIVYGWDDSASAKAVDLSVMVAVRVDQAPQPVASCGPAESEPIDITPQDVVSDSSST